MPRILGVDIPKEKRIEASLKYIYGVGPKRALDILREANIDADRRAKDLNEEEVSRLTTIIQTRYVTEGDLRREVNQNIKRMMDLAAFS
ncbi:MAG: 30S ribosomal protein S13 [Candidatus Omnitrophica bacterium]|nr:30S ribosomal protein S13 [Candidatus Omnitrophota bacterium]